MELEINLDEQLLTDKQAAYFLNIPEKRMKAWRYEGKGPKCIRLGDGSRAQVRHAPSMLRQFVLAHIA